MNRAFGISEVSSLFPTGIFIEYRHQLIRHHCANIDTTFTTSTCTD